MKIVQVPAVFNGEEQKSKLYRHGWARIPFFKNPFRWFSGDHAQGNEPQPPTPWAEFHSHIAVCNITCLKTKSPGAAISRFRLGCMVGSSLLNVNQMLIVNL